MDKTKYSARLSKPITPDIFHLDQTGGFEEWLKSGYPRREYIRRMFELLTHYKIDPAGKDCWFALACELAGDHIKGFTVATKHRGPGRPKKVNPLPQQPKRKRGRPETNTLDDAKEIVRIVDGKKQALEHEKGGRITYKETLEHLIRKYAKSINKSPAVIISTELPRYQKLLSASRKKIRENTS